MLGIRMEGVRDLLLGSVKGLQRGPLKGQVKGLRRELVRGRLKGQLLALNVMKGAMKVEKMKDVG